MLCFHNQFITTKNYLVNSQLRLISLSSRLSCLSCQRWIIFTRSGWDWLRQCIMTTAALSRLWPLEWSGVAWTGDSGTLLHWFGLDCCPHHCHQPQPRSSGLVWSPPSSTRPITHYYHCQAQTNNIRRVLRSRVSGRHYKQVWYFVSHCL